MNKKALIIVALAAVVAVALFGNKKYAEVRQERDAQARHEVWIATSVRCDQCFRRFIPEKNKAPLTEAISAGAVTGATLGGIGGMKAGAGTGVVVGGAPGGVAGSTIAGVGGVVAGGIIGGVSGAWYADGRVQCPYCLHVFPNPKN